MEPRHPLLPPGARVGIVSPSGLYEEARLQAGLEHLRSWGYQPVPAPHLGQRHRYLAGPVEARAADLRWALTEPSLHAAWFARGGFGAAHLLPQLGVLPPGARPLLGFSDATALFCGLRRAPVARGIHAPVLHSLVDATDERSQEALRVLLQEGRFPVLPGRPLGPGFRPRRGPLVGGNLCVLASLCGTPWALRARGAIVLLEEIAEPPYKVDRLLTQLLQSGALRGARGLVLGSFTRCDPPEGAGYTLEEVLRERLEPLGLPILVGAPVGHGAENLPWRVGGRVELREDGVVPLAEAP